MTLLEVQLQCLKWHSEFDHLTRDVMIISDEVGEPVQKRIKPSFSSQFRSYTSFRGFKHQFGFAGVASS